MKYKKETIIFRKKIYQNEYLTSNQRNGTILLVFNNNVPLQTGLCFMLTIDIIFSTVTIISKLVHTYYILDFNY